jgi:hypothetical protein
LRREEMQNCIASLLAGKSARRRATEGRRELWAEESGAWEGIRPAGDSEESGGEGRGAPAAPPSIRTGDARQERAGGGGDSRPSSLPRPAEARSEGREEAANQQIELLVHRTELRGRGIEPRTAAARSGQGEQSFAGARVV